MTKNRVSRELTNKPAPLLPGLYSMQAVSAVEGVPDVTMYHPSVGEVTAWKDEMSKKKLFSRFLLRSALDSWDVYDAAGKLESLCDDVVGSRAREIRASIKVDRSLFLVEASTAIGEGFSCAVVAEGHAGASCADHSNYVSLSRELVMLAPPEDMRHMRVVESHTWKCRVAGLFIRLSEVSPKTQDLFLDFHKWLSKSWPLSNANHKQILTHRLSLLRKDYVADIFADALFAAGDDADICLSAKLLICLTSEEKLTELTGALVDTCYDALIYPVGAAETFAPDVLAARYVQLAASYRKIMG